tara:strand:+ start:2263 stop:2556 length:294 start_codon:yes stop_codon:yes gene_type:complete
MRFPLRQGDSVSVRLGFGLGRHEGDYEGCQGPTKGFYDAKILTVHENTSLVRFRDKICPDYPEGTWKSFLKTNPELSDADRCHVDEVMNIQLTYLGL